MAKNPHSFHLKFYQNTFTFIFGRHDDDLYYFIDSDICPSSHIANNETGKKHQIKPLSIVFPSPHSKLLPISLGLTTKKAFKRFCCCITAWPVDQNFRCKMVIFVLLSSTSVRTYASCFRHRCKLLFETSCHSKKHGSRTSKMLRSWVNDATALFWHCYNSKWWEQTLKNKYTWSTGAQPAFGVLVSYNYTSRKLPSDDLQFEFISCVLKQFFFCSIPLTYS